MALIQLIKLIAQEGVENYVLLLQRWHPKTQRRVSDSLVSRTQIETHIVRRKTVYQEKSFQYP